MDKAVCKNNIKLTTNYRQYKNTNGNYSHINNTQSFLLHAFMTNNNLRLLEIKLNMLGGATRIRHKMYNNLFNGAI